MSIRGVIRKERQLLRRVQRDAMKESTRVFDRKVTDTSHKHNEPDYITPEYETLAEYMAGIDNVISMKFRHVQIRTLPCAICKEDMLTNYLVNINGRMICKDCDPRFVRWPRYYGA